MSPASPRERASYHHGAVREAALTEGLALLASDDPSALTLREVARRVGVAHHALYHHFADKAALERALAARGFDTLADEVAEVREPAGFIAAYAQFALANRPLYDLMMRQPYGAFESDPELRVAADRVITTSLRVLAPDAPDPETGRRTVMRSWMLAHGGLALHTMGVLRMRDDAAFVGELLRIAGLAPHETEGPQDLWGGSTEEDPG